MEEFNSSFEHEAGYLDPRLGVSSWRSSSLAAHDNPSDFSDFALAGGFEYNPTQRLAYSAFDNVINEMQDQLPSPMSSRLDTQHEQHQFPGQLQSEPEPVSRCHGPNLADNETYTEFCGVYSPEKVPPVRTSQRKHSPYHCPRCDSRFTLRAAVKPHFRRCIAKHGNPDALRWNDHVSLKPLREGERKDKARSDEFRGRLKAYSGVMIPSKLPPGGVIVKFVSSVGKGNHLCAICGGGPFSIARHVKSHFLTCVKKHGNHTGANWYDRLDANHDENHLSGKPAATANAFSAM